MRTIEVHHELPEQSSGIREGDKAQCLNAFLLNNRLQRRLDIAIGDAGRAKKLLGWEAKTRFPDLVKLMVDADLEVMRREIR